MLVSVSLVVVGWLLLVLVGVGEIVVSVSGVGVEVVGSVVMMLRILVMSCVSVEVKDGGDLLTVVCGARWRCNVKRSVACTGYL